MGSECIAVKKLVHGFNGKTVLDGIDLTVERGEVFGLLGPSGAGKTTLIRILTGQLKPDGGTAAVWGKRSDRLEDSDYRRIGVVMDAAGLYERLSCYDNLLLFTRIYGLKPSRIMEVLEQVGLADAAKKPAGHISKGMKQRLVLARAILHEPDLLFMDEPTSGLDPKTAAAIWELINKSRKKGTAVFLTTHNMEEAYRLCSHIALLDGGRIIEYGVPEEVCRKYDKNHIISVLLKSGESMGIPNKKESAELIRSYLETEQIASIHSQEPNLETVFIELTGRRLDG